jgi:protein gp37
LVNALSDLFHESAPIETIDRVFAIMALAPRHIFQILTKRPKIMQTYIADKATPGRITHEIDEIAPDPNSHAIAAWPLPNVWLGVTAENQKEAERRIPVLLQTPAMSHLMLKSAKRASLIENLRSLRGFDKMLVR